MKRNLMASVVCALAILTVIGCSKEPASDLPPSSDPSIGQPSQVREKGTGDVGTNRGAPVGGKAAVKGGKG
jgi:hypothetical protein